MGRPAYDYVIKAFGELKSSIDLRDDRWEIGGYQVMMADQGNFIAVEMRNRMFSRINDYITTTSASQMGQGSSDVRHIAAWDKPLLPRDTRRPPAEVRPPFWDPKPVQMMTNAQLHAALAEMRTGSTPKGDAEAAGAKADAEAGGGTIIVVNWGISETESTTGDINSN